jgi:uncharacterized protein (DUF488 family)
MYYRRKIILAILEAWGGKLSNTSFQKLLFLFCKSQINPSFSFVPYKFGCLSFQSYQDRRALIFYGNLAKVGYWHKLDSKSYIEELEERDRKILKTIRADFKDFNQEKLIKHVYKNFPYYATKSEIAEKFLNKTDLKKVEKIKTLDESLCLSTIGYEGISIDDYLNKLVVNNIKLVCDVRKNPISMKYGFSKQQLKKHLEKIDVDYIHLPDLGIESKKRQDLKSQKDYKRLFSWYEKKVLPNKNTFLEHLIEYFVNYKRIALTCFESSHLDCHRHKIVNALIPRITFDYKLLNL